MGSQIGPFQLLEFKNNAIHQSTFITEQIASEDYYECTKCNPFYNAETFLLY